MQVFECVRTRRAVREYKAKPVPDDVILRIVEAGRLAPSSKNSQPWHYIIVKDRANLVKLSTLTPTGSHIAHAAMAIAVVTDPAYKLHAVDGGRAVQNMVLVAWEDGVGSCWVSNFSEEAKDLLKIPRHLNLLTIVSFGYPVESTTRRKKIRKQLTEVASLEAYGTPIADIMAS